MSDKECIVERLDSGLPRGEMILEDESLTLAKFPNEVFLVEGKENNYIPDSPNSTKLTPLDVARCISFLREKGHEPERIFTFNSEDRMVGQVILLCKKTTP